MKKSVKAKISAAVKAGKPPRVKKPSPPKKNQWVLRLYVAGETQRSLTAFANLKKICEQHLVRGYSIEVIDLSKQPHLAQADQIVALPTLVRKMPEPIRRVIGDLSNNERVLVGMDLTSANPLHS